MLRIHKYRPDFEGTCPCGKKIYVDSAKYAVIHELPIGEKFRDLSPDKFLRYVRQATTGITDN